MRVNSFQLMGLLCAVVILLLQANTGLSVSVAILETNPQIVVSGTNAADVAPTVTGGGFINVQNNGGHVTVTETGTGTINIVNNGGVLTATNTGNGVMTIVSTATGAVTITNTGNGRITLYATGAAATTITHTGDDDITYSPSGAVVVKALPHLLVTGTNATAVVPIITGGGFIDVQNNGGRVVVTETGTGTVNIVNNGGVLTATNTGNGVMTIVSTATGAVTVTNTGNGRTTVYAAGSAAVAITHTGDDDITYSPTGIVNPPVCATVIAADLTPTSVCVVPPHILVYGSNAAGVTPVVTGGGSINVQNNGGLVAVTETGLGTIDIVNNGGVLTATNTGDGQMTIVNTATGAVTITNTGNGRVTVYATGSAAITFTHTGDDDVIYPSGSRRGSGGGFQGSIGAPDASESAQAWTPVQIGLTTFGVVGVVTICIAAVLFYRRRQASKLARPQPIPSAAQEASAGQVSV
jgi:fibronectin-binding autotransporter adhesin